MEKGPARISWCPRVLLEDLDLGVEIAWLFSSNIVGDYELLPCSRDVAPALRRFDGGQLEVLRDGNLWAQ